MGGCLPRAWRSASVAPLSSRYSDLRTHAIPAGVTARRSPRLVCAFLIVIFIILLSQQLFFCSKQQRSEEHTSELQSRGHLVCRLLLEKENYPTSHSD